MSSIDGVIMNFNISSHGFKESNYNNFYEGVCCMHFIKFTVFLVYCNGATLGKEACLCVISYKLFLQKLRTV